MKFLSVVGARPQFIKAALLSKELRKKNKEILVHTGQHYAVNMSDKFFRELSIPQPKINLNVGSGFHGYQTGKMMIGLEQIMIKEKPDLVIVFGDTNSTVAGAMAASKLKIPVAHVEAGLREFDKTIPEEINKVITDHISSILFAPTPTGVKNLKKEGIVDNVYMVGDISIGLTDQIAKKAKKNFKILKKFGVSSGDYYLATIHREKNTDVYNNLKNILEAFSQMDVNIIFPIHPRTIKAIKKFSLSHYLNFKNIKVIEPLGYLEIISLLINSKLVITDSGGIIKESYFVRKPCITISETTEWVETVDDGWNKLTLPVKGDILRSVAQKHRIKRHRSVFGDGKTHKYIAKFVNEFLNKN